MIRIDNNTKIIREKTEDTEIQDKKNALNFKYILYI